MSADANPSLSMATAGLYNYSVVFDFEKNWDEDYFWKWMLKNWSLSFWYSAIYIVVVFGGKWYMEDRPRYELRYPLAMWSGILAVFSIFGMIRTFPELWHVLTQHGFEATLCNPSYFRGPTAFWCFMFTASKVYELGDTLFIILRKQQLIFLHWYHHITVLLYVWYSYTEHIANGRWFMVMNYTVHAFMYSYYTLRALRFRIPKQVSMVITSMQLTQMIIGLTINIYSYKLLRQGLPCNSLDNFRYSLLMYFSYFLLFGHFFYNAYLVKKEPSKEKLK